jgi:hypothetical protein
VAVQKLHVDLLIRVAPFQELDHSLEHLVAGGHRGQGEIAALLVLRNGPVVGQEHGGFGLAFAHRRLDEHQARLGQLGSQICDSLLQRPCVLRPLDSLGKQLVNRRGSLWLTPA